METNKITIAGTLMEDFVFDHEYQGERFCRNTVKVERLSGDVDELPIIVSDKLLMITKIGKGDKIRAIGQIRSRNAVVDGKSRLFVRIFVQDLFVDGSVMNDAYLVGFVCKPPVYRRTPKGRDIADMLVAVNRRCNKSDYIPCIVWGRNAKFASGLKVGDKVVIKGRFQSRNYTKQLPTGLSSDLTAYELSVQQIVIGDNLDGVYNSKGDDV